MVALKAMGGILVVIAFVFFQAARMGTREDPIGPAYDEQTTARTGAAIGLPIFLGFLAFGLGLAFL